LDDVGDFDIPYDRSSKFVQTSSNDHAAKAPFGLIKNRCTTDTIKAAKVVTHIGCKSLPDKRVR
jgi:hypothetical protein